MKYPRLIILVLTLGCTCFCQAIMANPGIDSLINFNWDFYLGDLEHSEVMDLNAEDWRILDLPHDWSIEGEYSEDHGTDWQSGFLPAGIGWYRKQFDYNPVWKGKMIRIHFEGVYLNSDVWLNGHHLGHRPNGYIGFEYDLTPYLKADNNIIVVRVDHSQPLSGRWYTGSGIYRNVRLKIQDKLHIANWGVFFSTPIINQNSATYQVEVDVVNMYNNERNVFVTAKIFDLDRRLVSQIVSDKVNILANQEYKFILKDSVSDIHLWTPDNPKLYILETSIIYQNEVSDLQKQNVGFRKLEFGADYGFKLNNKTTKLKGVTDHHTAGALGAAVPDDVWRYRLLLLKQMGCNAIRTAHNPFSTTFYNICDSLGIMVLNEFLDGWDTEKAKHDYGLYFRQWWAIDATAFIKRDRNHPSIIMWSIGNEVRKPDRSVQKQLVELFHNLDPTRPITQGGHDPTRGMTGDDLPSQLDIKGFNGDGEEKDVFEKFHIKEPKMPMIGTEVPHTYQTRGVYRTKTQWRRKDFPAMWEKTDWDGTLRGLDNRLFPIADLTETEIFCGEQNTTWYKNGEWFPIDIKRPYQYHLYYQSSYDNASVRSSARKAWQRTRDLDYVMGQFRWGSFDYLGETNDWPSRFGNFGIIDICGFPKDHYFLYKSMWTNEPMVHILPHWSLAGKEGLEIPVVVYTNCENVELFLNDKSLGEKDYHDEQLVWNVQYKPGVLKAIARNSNIPVATHQHITSGIPSVLDVTSDKQIIRANRTDVVHVEVNIRDDEENFCPLADNVIEFSVSGPVRIIGIDNGDPLDLSNYKTNIRKAFRGKVMLWVQSNGETGTAIIEAKANNIKADQIEIKVY